MTKDKNQAAKRKAAKKTRRARRVKSRTLGERSGSASQETVKAQKVPKAVHKKMGPGTGTLIPSKSFTRRMK